MKVLLINFAMDPSSPVLAWQHSVALRLSAKCDRLVVLTERASPGVLPRNVEVHKVPRMLTTPLRVLGVRWLMNLPVWRWCTRERFDVVFVHMNADWVYRLAPCWRWFRVPVLLWYAHGTVTRRLARAHRRATCVITSTPEGFRIPSSKVRVIGQGIDTDMFRLAPVPSTRPTIVAVGRVSRRKRIDLMLETMAWLAEHAPQHPFVLRVVGPSLTADDAVYAEELRTLVTARGLKDRVTFEGPKQVGELPAIFSTAFVHLNLSQTGSLDKAILESLACGCPTLTSSAAVFPLLKDWPQLTLHDPTPAAIGRRLCQLYEQRDATQSAALRRLVVGHHDLDSYASRVWSILTELAREAA